MGFSWVKIIVVGLFGVLCAERAWSIATANWAVSEAAPAGHGYSVNLDYVYSYKGSSAVAVGRYWLLTAAHVADDGGSGNIVVNETTYIQQEVVAHDWADLALVRFDLPFPGYYALHDSVPVGEEVVVAGYGFPGNAYVGWNSAFFDEVQPGRGVLRWGTNRIEAEVRINGEFSSEGFRCMLSTMESGESTAYECGANVNDSGGGVFVNDGGTWKLAGILGNRLGLAPRFTGFNGPAIAPYRDWILEAVYLSSASEQLDSDGDGFTDAQEWVSQTHPLDSAAYFRISQTLPPSRLVFESSTNRQYCVECTTDLTAEWVAWQTDTGWFMATSTQTVYTATIFDRPCYYRVRVRLP